MSISKIGFGGSCHWCTEAVFQTLTGVIKVEQGWIAALEAKDYHEAIIVHYEEEAISLKVLIDIHLHTHNSTSNHSMRKRYRSAVYAFSPEQMEVVNGILEELQAGFEDKLVTRSYLFSSFKSSEEAFRNYYLKNPDKPFCKSYIDPKLRLVLDRYSNYIKDK